MNNSEMCEIAKKYENRGNIGKAYQLYLEAALAEDDGETMYALANMYFDGEYVHESYDKAGKYFGMAYDRDVNIQPWKLIIAGGYWEKRYNDEGDEESLSFAIRYYQAAVDQGVAYGHECLGQLYYNRGEYDKAYEHLKHMDGKNPCGLYYMARLYDEGKVVKQDKEKAIELYKKAVEQGGEYGDVQAMMAKVRLEKIAE